MESYHATDRILDAAINRVRESLRVLEDAVRFLADDASLTAALKNFRHEFVAVTSRFSLEARLAARATETDVGTEITTLSEQVRATLETVVTANFCRLQESLRSIEEFAKLATPAIAVEIEQLRYRSYTLQKSVWRAFHIGPSP